jgi:hypothetical protein
MIPAFDAKGGFDWKRVVFGVEGGCAYCGAALGADPLRLFSVQGEAAAFCDACGARWFGRPPGPSTSSGPAGTNQERKAI